MVPGGGPFADAVREFDAARAALRRRRALDGDPGDGSVRPRAGRADRRRRAGGGARRDRGRRSARPGVAVLAPSRWMRAADVLPHSWAATSDSVAAFVAGALDAERLVLIKPVGRGRPHGGAWWIGCFASVLPAGLPWSVIGWERGRRAGAGAGSQARGPAETTDGGYAVRSRRAGRAAAASRRQHRHSASGRHRPAEQVALHRVAPLRPQHVALLRRSRRPRRPP